MSCKFSHIWNICIIILSRKFTHIYYNLTFLIYFTFFRIKYFWDFILWNKRNKFNFKRTDIRMNTFRKFTCGNWQRFYIVKRNGKIFLFLMTMVFIVFFMLMVNSFSIDTLKMTSLSISKTLKNALYHIAIGISNNFSHPTYLCSSK